MKERRTTLLIAALLAVGSAGAATTLAETTALTLLGFSAFGLPSLAAASGLIGYDFWRRDLERRLCPECSSQPAEWATPAPARAKQRPALAPVPMHLGHGAAA